MIRIGTKMCHLIGSLFSSIMMILPFIKVVEASLSLHLVEKSFVWTLLPHKAYLVSIIENKGKAVVAY